MAAEYQYDPGLVFDDTTLTPAGNVSGVLLDRAGGATQPVFDMAGNQITSLRTNGQGYVARFRASIPIGVLSFGSVLQPVASVEAMNSASLAQQAALDAAAASTAAQQAAISAQNSASTVQALGSAVADLQSRVAALEAWRNNGTTTRVTGAKSSAWNVLATATGPQLYVSASGNNANSGTSVGSPKQTIAAAFAIATAGTTINVAPGTYTNTSISGGPGGTTNPVIIKSTQKWGATLQASGAPAFSSNADNVWLVDFDITSPNYHRCVSSDNCSYNWTVGCHIHDVLTTGSQRDGGGVVHGGLSNYAGSNNAVLNCVINNIANGSSLNHAVYINNPGGLVANNIIYHVNGGWGIHCYHAPSGVVVANNLVFDCPGQGGIGIAATSDVGASITFGIGLNNIVANCSKGYSTFGSDPNGIIIWRNNHGWNNSSNEDVQGHTAGFTTGDPLFVNWQLNGSGNYHLQPLSPCKDTGYSGSPNYAYPTDMDGIARPQGAGIDRGPYERA